ncbi:LacI family DNA-binding transcriptional regulator [Shewanella sp. NIFS-20-20]|uniref:LacI family DNA-binding transcriptional regulator n=1 Tax=Shewanella sp. NIFS-20-20 TaxID=2853806 RepID=UPI001C44E514|nr:LacI family DNA-binding transcriptional regulator [Shewanella sp. NIFS-20-20]MBV7314172.1 LacI family DNA-binding transcriptional regulator [Shewanella sp. NIFS-20-20]
MKVTINDVAKYAGVSIKTVSRVTNNEPQVKQSTIDKVNEAIKALHYQPNQSARNLASSSAYVIGFVYDNPNAYYIIEMQNGILSACRDQGYELLIHPCDASSDDICQELCDLILHTKLAGLVLTPPLSENPHVLAALDNIGAQYVRIIAGASPDTQTPAQGLQVLVNDKVGAIAITEHLIELGHSQIAFISGDTQHQSTKQRFDGFLQALDQHGLSANPDYLIDGQYSFESGVAGANTLLALPTPPTAIVACNDEIAAGALFAARLSGVAIPAQISIVGFEDSPFSRQTWPKLTTVHQPNQEIAQLATCNLINKCRRRDHIDGHIFIPQPVVRDSTAKPTD